MKKAIAILLTALLLLTVFVSCEGDVEDLFGDNITITFNGNGSTGGQMAALKVARGKEVRLTANAYEKTDSEFTGWNTKADGSGVNYDDEEFVYFEEDTTLYAQWSEGPNLIKSTTEAITLSSGDWTIEDTTVTVTGRITVSGTVNLLLPDGKTLNASSGITVSEGNTLVIDKFDSESTGTGTLNATGVNNSAGIGGGGNNQAGGTITINGGNVTATGGYSGAGIGGGNNGSGGMITISDTAYVTATGGYSGAGIGGGNKGSGGIITISDTADVTATGGSDAAGIGGGYNGAGGTITISGGTVNATGVSGAAGIGGGMGIWDNHSVGAGGTISISGGDITATGGDYGGAGIGGGLNGDGGTLSVSDGTVVANGDNNGAGIGGGAHADGGEVTIEGGTVSATGNAGGAGIGGGGNYNYAGGAGAVVTIKGGVVTATGGVSAVGIGAGNGSSNHKTLTIGTGVTVWVKDSEEASWASYVVDVRHKYMKAEEGV